MKHLFIMTVFFASMNSFAGKLVEFDHSLEVKCHKEIKSLGCTTDTDNELTECVEKKKAKLSQECLALHAARNEDKSI